MRWTKVLTVGAAASLGFVAACGAPAANTGNNGASGGNDKVEGAAAALDPNAKGPAPEVPGAKKGGTLTVSYSTVPANFDPSDQFYQDTAVIFSLTHRALTTFTMRNGKMVLVPDLATDLGKSSEDGLTWTFTLKDGIKYEDGTPVKAQDIVFAAKRSFDPDLAANGPTYQREFFKGGADYQGPYKGDKNWNGVEAKDDKTVVFHLEKRFETLPYFVSFNQFTPIPEAKDKKADYQLHPLATGPYMFDKYTPGTELTLKRNPNWDPATDPARNDYPDAFHFKFGQDVLKTQTAILASNGDDATTLNWDSIDSSLVPQIEGEKKAQFEEGPSSCVIMVNMDATKIPMPVRKAIAKAWPFDSIHKAGGETSHSYSPASTIIPPQIPGHLDYVVDGMNGKGDGDAAAAKKMLADAGYGPDKPFELTYYYTNDDDIAQKVNQVRKQKLQDAGFKVTDIGVPGKERRKIVGKPNGKYNMLQSPRGWCFDWPSADSIIPPTIGSIALSQGGTTFGNFSDAKIDAEIKRIQQLSITDQGPEWGKMDKWLTENYLLAIPDYNDKGNSVFGTKVMNVHNNPNKGMPEITQIWINQ
ncbi:ABC transporter substrate-binding protein [Intrasporangium oryzae NRRL B-24470]|uniref:ABC transporter substrate-binding protein n=1 Tax=Intrasporangium oryzae NRRL B-24470 TaxID=1386089 RepID=W9G9T4_9MICO|nr:ABC transporter substrate-binding protein [Intrasporangium oryzae]EWT02961.1 ABC transporter substrate-binding protein [Intrasporangium oryzae NRRL B-24470]